MGRDHHHLEADVVVVGGGLAGVCASLAAARNGATVVLVHDRPVLGGNTSSEICVHAGGADHDGSRPHARESGIIEELRLEDAVKDPRCVPVMWDLILYDAVRRERGITLLLNTSCWAANMATRHRIGSITAIRPSTHDTFVIEGRLFIDSTGDGWLGYFAGADFRQGREAPEEYNEPHAQGPDSKTMGASLMFLARDIGEPVEFQPPPWARKFLTCDALPHRHPTLTPHGFWWNELGGLFDMTKDTERVRDELVATLLGLWDHIKNHCPECSDKARTWELTWFGWVPGKRETRRLVGDHVLTENDLVDAVLFPDRVAHGGWPIDLHPPRGLYDPEPPAAFVPLADIYSIPLRALYSRNIENLLFAGRCISATHVAMGSTRLAATGAAMGQAVGTAAAMCAAKSITPRELADRHIDELQEKLLRQDQYIPDLAAGDPDDLARRASIAASSAAEDSPPENVTNGVTRHRRGATNQWASAPDQVLPQWLELRWPQPQEISLLEFTFDTGFARPLTHTQYPHSRAKQVRGPQPETVKDARIEAWLDGGWRHVATIRGNYRRKVVLELLSPVRTDRLRLIVEATNGEPQARVYEVRAYATSR
ncbi:MAG: FAD-dependent oxidoreductase [Armatimonadetes bacterium]|nr:FAD-dependent oxidoreductase [Armatimonadota bacterium]